MIRTLVTACLSLFVAARLLVASEPASTASFARRAEGGEKLSVVFFGGSLTWGANASDPLTTSWRGRMMSYLTDRFPNAHFRFYDAAIGGTGSMLGLYRLDRDVLSHKPDLVFLEFTMNDGADGTDPQTLAAYERLLRGILENGSAVQPVITTFEYLVKPPSPPKTPRVDAHLKLAKAYGLVPANIYQALRDAVQKKRVDPAALWPIDGIHPGDPGYERFFDVVRDQLEKNIAGSGAPHIPAATVFPDLYPEINRHILVDFPLPEGWKRGKTRRTSLWFDGLPSRWMGDVAAASASNGVTPKPLEVKFRGSMVGLFGERDSVSVPFNAWIDGKPVAVPKRKGQKSAEPDYLWKTDTARFSPPRAGTGILFSWVLLANNLTDGEHTLRIEPIFKGADPKAQLRLESVCSAGRR